MSIFAIADLHLSFAPDSDKPMDVFGSRWIDHPARIKESWCSNVTEEDTVVVAGDISWGMKLADAVYDLDWVDALPGHKVMLKGNHDLWWSGINRLNSMYDSISFLQNDAYCVHQEERDIWICGSRGWITPDDDDYTESDEKIYKREILRLRASLQFAADAAKASDREREIIGFLHMVPLQYSTFSWSVIFSSLSISRWVTGVFGSFKSKSGYEAMPRIYPVLGSMTMAMAFCGFIL